MLLSGCAQQLAPQGGPKDEAPPVVLSEEPENSNQLSSRKIKLSLNSMNSFDLKNPQENVHRITGHEK